MYSTIATDSEGIPSKFGQYNPLYRGGGGGAAVNWTIVKNLTQTVDYIAGIPISRSQVTVYSTVRTTLWFSLPTGAIAEPLA